MEARVMAAGDEFRVDGLDPTLPWVSTLTMLVPLPMDGDRVRFSTWAVDLGEWEFSEASGQWELQKTEHQLSVTQAGVEVLRLERQIEQYRQDIKSLSRLISELRWKGLIAWTLVAVLIIAVIAALSN